MKVPLKNQKGIASFESVFMMIVFVIMVTFGVGCFGIVHTAILNNIAARTYAWETFNHRANVQIFRDNRTRDEIGPDGMGTYVNYQFRVHTISSEDAEGDVYHATERTLAMGRNVEIVARDSGTHARLRTTTRGRERIGVNPVWIKAQYGICIDYRCGGINL